MVRRLENLSCLILIRGHFLENWGKVKNSYITNSVSLAFTSSTLSLLYFFTFVDTFKWNKNTLSAYIHIIGPSDCEYLKDNWRQKLDSISFGDIKRPKNF